MSATNPAPRVSVVIPFYDEADNVAGLLEEIARVMPAELAWELVAVDDASADDTVARLERAFAALGLRGRIVVHGRNRGQSAALCSGFEAARGDWVVTLDGDGQNDPGDIPALLALCDGAAPPDLVCGWRRQRRDDALRRLSSRLANAVRGGLLGDRTPDTGCGLKLARRALLLSLPRFDHMHRFLPALARREGAQVISVAVGHRPRRHGRSKYGVWNRLWVGIVDLAGVMWLARRAFRNAPSRVVHHDG